MKRFFCKVCKRVKRVRVYPFSVRDTDITSNNPKDRIGTCARHTFPNMRAYNESLRPSKPKTINTKSLPVVKTGRKGK